MFARKISSFVKARLLATGAVVSLVAVAALVAFVVLPSAGRTAHAATPNSSMGGGCFSPTGPACTFKDNSADAYFQSFSSDGCTLTDASINGFQNLTRPGNMTTQFAFVSMEEVDICNNFNLLKEAFNRDFTGTVQVGANLSTATVTGTATMIDFVSNTTFTATINVTWQGFGPTTRTIDSSHYHAPGFIVNSHFNGTSRVAEASGTLSDGTSNFAASPTLLYTELLDSTGGTVQITGP
jgi:hypothetical protein